MARKHNRVHFSSVPVANIGGNGRPSEFRRKGSLMLKLSDSTAMDTSGNIVTLSPSTKVKVLA